jgi:hypothetical protein
VFILPSNGSLQRHVPYDLEQQKNLRDGTVKHLIERKKQSGGIRVLISRDLPQACAVHNRPDGTTRVYWWTEPSVFEGSSLPWSTVVVSAAGTCPVVGNQIASYVGAVVQTSEEYVVRDVLADIDEAAIDASGERTNVRFRGFFADVQPQDQAGHGMPVVLILLHGTVGMDRKFFLQRRTELNSTDSFDMLSLVSGRLVEQDLLDSLPGKMVVNPNQSPDDAAGRIGKAMAGDPRIPLEAFRRAALRECYASLGLHVAPERLRHHSLPPQLMEVYKSPPIFPQLFDLELIRSWDDGSTEDELARIRERRPHVGVESFTWPEILKLDTTRLNGFLRRARDDYLDDLIKQLARV